MDFFLWVKNVGKIKTKTKPIALLNRKGVTEQKVKWGKLMDLHPKIDVPKSKTEKIVNILSFLMILFTFIYIIVIWDTLPDRVPSHFNATGEADRFGGKGSVLILPIIGSFLFLLLYLLNQFPYAHSFPVKVTEENAERLYKTSRLFMSILNFEIVFFITIGAYKTIQASLGESGLGVWYLPAVLITLFTTIGLLIYRLYKIK